MSSVVDELFAKASTLTDEERATLAGRLFETLDRTPPDEGVEEAWAREIERRVADYRAGRVKTISWEELRASLANRRR